MDEAVYERHQEEAVLGHETSRIHIVRVNGIGLCHVLVCGGAEYIQRFTVVDAANTIRRGQNLIRRSPIGFVMQSYVSKYWVHLVNEQNTLSFPTIESFILWREVRPAIYNTVGITEPLPAWMGCV
jgi:hypothetical protein